MSIFILSENEGLTHIYLLAVLASISHNCDRSATLPPLATAFSSTDHVFTEFLGKYFRHDDILSMVLRSPDWGKSMRATGLYPFTANPSWVWWSDWLSGIPLKTPQCHATISQLVSYPSASTSVLTTPSHLGTPLQPPGS